jgi:hypothetical protein
MAGMKSGHFIQMNIAYLETSPALVLGKLFISEIVEESSCFIEVVISNR